MPLSPGILPSAKLVCIASLVLLNPLFASPSQAGRPAESSMDGIVEGMGRLNGAFGKDNGYIISYKDTATYYDAAGRETNRRHETVEHRRQDTNVLLHVRNLEAEPGAVAEEWINWKDGVCVQRKGDSVYLWPFLISQGWQYDQYAMALFVDTSEGLEFGNPTYKKNYVGKNPSEQYVLVLPRLILQNRDKYRIRPEQEEVDGSPCHVLEWPDRDIVWVDTQHGFVARRRQFYPSKGRMSAEWRNRKVSQHPSGLWIPSEQEETIFFAPKGDLAEPGKVRRKSQRKLTSLTFKSQQASDFKVPMQDLKTFPVIDGVRRVSYVKYDGSHDPLTDILDNARKAMPRVQLSRGSRFWLFNGIALGVVALWLQMRGRRPVPQA